MVEITADDGQTLVALNEIYLGHPSHQTARYRLDVPRANGVTGEEQASSGLIVASGTGATGWCRSAWLERHSALRLSTPEEQGLAWFVREAWPSPTTGANYTEGLLTREKLRVTIESDRLVAFGDGIEDDHLDLSWDQQASVGVSDRVLRLVRG